MLSSHLVEHLSTDHGTSGSWPQRALQFLRHAGRALRTILGAPDYEAYVERLAAIHPQAIPINRAEFAAQHLEKRFSTPGSRCC